MTNHVKNIYKKENTMSRVRGLSDLLLGYAEGFTNLEEALGNKNNYESIFKEEDLIISRIEEGNLGLIIIGPNAKYDMTVKYYNNNTDTETEINPILKTRYDNTDKYHVQIHPCNKKTEEFLKETIQTDKKPNNASYVLIKAGKKKTFMVHETNRPINPEYTKLLDNIKYSTIKS